MERSIVDFTADDKGIGTLARAVPRVDPTTTGTQQWDVDFTFDVDEGQAEHVQPAAPQAVECLARARDGKGSSVLTFKPTQRDVRLTVRTTDENGESVLDDVAAEVRHIRLNLTEKAQAYMARVRVYGLNPEQGARLLGSLGKPVGLEVRPSQLAMDFSEGAPLGAVVSGSDGVDTVFGVLHQKRGESYIINDFGVHYTVGAITASLQVERGDMPRSDEYANKVREQGGAPSWRMLVSAMGEAGTTTRLTDEIVNRALEMHLPPEPKVAGKRARG